MLPRKSEDGGSRAGIPSCLYDTVNSVASGCEMVSVRLFRSQNTIHPLVLNCEHEYIPHD